MPNQSRLFHMSPLILRDYIRAYTALPAGHPAKIGFRTYGLGLLLSLGPGLLSFVAKVVVTAKGGKVVDCVRTRKVVAGLGRLLRRELGPFGFAFAITAAVAGGSFFQNLFESLINPLDKSLQNVKSDATAGGLGSTWSAKSRLWCYRSSLSDVKKTFLANALASAVAIILLQWKAAPGRRRDVLELPLTLPIPTEDIPKRKSISPTLNLTLLLLVRTLDSVVHGGLQGKLLQTKEREVTPTSTEPEKATSGDSTHPRKWINKWTSAIDSLVFCICSARCDRSASYGSPR